MEFAPYLFQGQASHVTESCAFSTSDQIVFQREDYLKIEPYNPMILSPMNINPDSHSRRIWKSLVLRVRLGTLGDPESFGTATWPKIVRKALGYPLAFLGKGTWLKSTVLKERLTIPDCLLRHPVWIHLVVPTANWESNHSPLGVAYNHQATTPSVSLLGSRLAARLAHGGVLGYILIASVYPKLKYLNSSYGGLAPPLNGLSKSTYLYHSSY
jgi:hypothetical protein